MIPISKLIPINEETVTSSVKAVGYQKLLLEGKVNVFSISKMFNVVNTKVAISIPE